MHRRLASLVRLAALAIALAAGGVALADVAPPPDAGPTVDMSSTMAKPDLSTPVNPTNDDGGCSMSAHGAPMNAVGLLFAGGVLGLAFASRKRRA